MKVRSVVLAVVIGLLVVIPAGPAMAHGDEEGDVTAKELVEQAIAILQSQPDEMGPIDERLAGALEDDEVEGVDLDLVRQAQASFDAGDVAKTLGLLARAIGVPPESVVPPAHDRQVGGGFQAPKGTAGPALIGIAAALALIGGIVVRKVH